MLVSCRYKSLVPRNTIGICRALQLLSPGHLGPLLHLVVGQNILVCGAGRGEGVQGVHLSHVPGGGEETKELIGLGQLTK